MNNSVWSTLQINFPATRLGLLLQAVNLNFVNQLFQGFELSEKINPYSSYFFSHIRKQNRKYPIEIRICGQESSCFKLRVYVAMNIRYLILRTFYRIYYIGSFSLGSSQPLTTVIQIHHLNSFDHESLLNNYLIRVKSLNGYSPKYRSCFSIIYLGRPEHLA